MIMEISLGEKQSKREKVKRMEDEPKYKAIKVTNSKQEETNKTRKIKRQSSVEKRTR